MMEKSVFNFKIQYEDGSVIDLHEDKKMWVSYFRIPPLSPEHKTESVEGRHGSVYLETILKERVVPAGIMIEGYDPLDFDLFRDEIYRMFNPLNKFYIIRDLQPGKRMEVSVASDFDIEYLTLEDGEFEISFVIHSVFLESLGTTLTPPEYGQMLQVREENFGDPPIQYTFNTNTFSVWNDGDVTVDPREHEMKITFQGISSNLTIKNLTTGEEWYYTGETNELDTLDIERRRSLKNDVSIFKNTNKKLITLVKGWNEFEITGATDFTISFDFRFYYV
jgi:Phage tail protein